MRSMKIGWFALLSLALLSLAPASGDPPSPDKVTISVIAIIATKNDKEIDKRLKPIAEELQKAVPALKECGFQFGKMTRKSVAVGANETFDLVDKQVATVAVLQAANKDDLIQLKLTPPQMGEVTYETSCGRFLPIITKYRTKDNNGVLILAVRVQPCRNK